MFTYGFGDDKIYSCMPFGMTEVKRKNCGVLFDMKMSKFEKKFGKYAISNLTLILIICYVAGYVIQLLELKNPIMSWYLTLDPYRILHGEIWRLVTWVLIPPSYLDLFTIVMLYFYYSIGTALERTWGAYRYNVYIFSGMFFTVIASFLCLGYVYLTNGGLDEKLIVEMFFGSRMFSTYYINLSIFLAFAATYPDAQVLLMFVIPVKMKWMAILDIVILISMLVSGDTYQKFAVAAALVNFVVFYLSTKNLYYMNPKQIKRKNEFKQDIRRNTPITRHKCAICGRTEETHPDLEFRFCSKCNGNYEYCQDHLFTHEHVK